MSKNRWMLVVVGLWLCAPSPDTEGASNAVFQSEAAHTIKVWDTDDGLPQNSVLAIARSRQGYLWLGTRDGLARFDGIRFSVFDEVNTPGLRSSYIVSLFEDSQGRLWLGTDTAGVAFIKDGQLRRVPIGQGGPERRLAGVCEGSQGVVWLYTANGELGRYENGRCQVFLMDRGRPSLHRSIVAEPSGRVWVGTDWGVSALGVTAASGAQDLEVEQTVAVSNKLDFLLASARGGYWRLADGRVQKWSRNGLERDLGPYPWRPVLITAACEDREGNLVVGTRGDGVFWFDTAGRATPLSTNAGLSYSYISSLLMDREGNLWVGTDGGGLNRVKRQVFEVLEETRDQVVQSVCEDSQDGLWAGYNAGAIDHWSEGGRQRLGPLMNASVRTVFADRDQRVWVGTWGAGLFQFENGRFQRAAGAEVIHPVVLALHQDRGGRLWVGTQGGLGRWDGQEWRLFTTLHGLTTNEVRAIADDPFGSLWIGTRGGGLNRWKDGQFTAYRQPDGLPSEDISSLYVDARGVLWIGTSGGLARFHGGQWTRYSKDEGLPTTRIGYLVEDGQGYLWMGSNAGLIRVKKQELNDLSQGLTKFVLCRAFGRPDGLPTGECSFGSQPGAWRTRGGRLFFPTIKGLVSVDPARLKPNTIQPPVMIESVLIDGQAQNTNSLRTGWSKAVKVPAGKQHLEIEYTSLNLAAPDRARFKYRLQGHETDWIPAGSIRRAHYSKLPQGEYRFEVTACNEDGVWNEAGSSLAIIVEPPFWRTWWFLTGTAVLLLGTIVAVVHYVSTQKLQRQLEGMRQQEALEKERDRIARDLHDQLGANLTQVSLLGEMVESDKNLPDEVESHARQISQTARETTRALDEIVWAANPANDTLEGLINYACKYAQEYLALAGVRYRLEAPSHLPGTPVPPDLRHNVFLAFKEAVNNVVKHAQASSARVRLKLEPAAFTLEIEDNGRGLAGLDEKRASSRNGMRNMRQRMEDIGGSFSIGPAPDGGTLVRLSAPIRQP